MPKYISIGNVAVAFSDLKELTIADKQLIIDSMFDNSPSDKLDAIAAILNIGSEEDGNGQIIFNTGLMLDHDRIVPFEYESEDDSDPFESEEEPEDDVYNDDMPTTMRDPFKGNQIVIQ